MLTDKEKHALNNCLLDDHILLEVELNVVTAESAVRVKSSSQP